MTFINNNLLSILVLYVAFRPPLIIAQAISSSSAHTTDLETGDSFGACASANTCSDCSRSAKAMLETSNGQYTCLWKINTISTPSSSDLNRIERNGGIHPLLEEHQQNPNLRLNTQQQQQRQQEGSTKNIVTCDLIPFSNNLISQLSIPCSIDPNNLSSMLQENDTSQQSISPQIRYPKRTITTFHWVGSLLIVFLFFLTLFRVRAVVLGKSFLPDSMTKVSFKKLNYKSNSKTTTNSKSYSYTPAPFLPHRNQEENIRQHSQNASKSLSEKNVQDSILALRSRSRGPNV